MLSHDTNFILIDTALLDLFRQRFFYHITFLYINGKM